MTVVALTHHADRALSHDARSALTADLLARAHTSPNPRERERLLDRVVIANQRVAEAVASRYRGRGIGDDDLVQTAYEGLVKAVHRFDPSQERDLLTYAVPTIRGELQRYFRDHSWTIRPPRRLQELQTQVNHAIAELSNELGREPEAGEVTERLGITRREYDDAVAAFGYFRLGSLDQPVGPDSATTVGDLVEDDDERTQEASDARVRLAPVVRRLSPRDRRIVYLRFFEDRTQEEIGHDLGVTQMQVSRLLTRILSELRTQVA